MKKRLFVIFTAILLVFIVLGTCFVDFLYKKTTQTEFSMGTLVSFALFGAQKDALLQASDLLSEIENASSVTISDSQASKLNALGTTSNPFLLEQAEVCLDVFLKSNGAFDFSIYPVTSLWAIGTPNAKKPESAELNEALLLVGSQNITLKNGVLTLGQAQKVDFGAVGKGYACDKLVALLRDKTRGGILSVGGSIAVWGKSGLTKNSYKIAVRNPFSTDYAGTVLLSEGFVSTSGAYERFFEQDGTRYHHIIDPKTAYPAQSDLASATVIASSGALSDALSTACFVLGADEGKKLLEKYNAQGVFITEKAEIIVVGNVNFTANEGFEVVK